MRRLHVLYDLHIPRVVLFDFGFSYFHRDRAFRLLNTANELSGRRLIGEHDREVDIAWKRKVISILLQSPERIARIVVWNIEGYHFPISTLRVNAETPARRL